MARLAVGATVQSVWVCLCGWVWVCLALGRVFSKDTSVGGPKSLRVYPANFWM